jgi:tetratricopeptide (TPR) repeat protein
MVKLKLSLLLTYFGVIALTQAQSIAPLSQKDSVDFLVTLAAKKFPSHPQQAEALAQRAHDYAVEEKYTAGEAKALFVIAGMLKTVNKNEESIQSYLKAARLFETLGDSSRAGRAYNGAVNIYVHKLNHYTKAYQYCAMAVALLEHDPVNLPRSLSNLASLHLQTGKFDEALELYKKNYDDERKNNNLQGMCIALNNIATAYDCKKDFKSSIIYYEKALEISRSLDDHRNTAHILIGLAPAYCALNNHKKSITLLKEAMAMASEHAFHNTQISALGYLCMESHHCGKLSQALRYSLESKSIADQYGLHLFKGNIYKQLSTIYTELKNPDEALRYHQRYARFQDSVANQERLAVASLDLSRKNITVEAGTTNNVLTENWMILASMTVLIPGIFFMYYKKRKGKDAPEGINIIDQQPQPVDQTLQEKQTEESSAVAEKAIQHLEVINGEGIKLLALSSVWWFQKEGKTYHAFTENGNYRVRQNISELETALPKNKFFRINRAVIINTDQMNNYSFWENHKYIIRMKDAKKSEFIISRNRLREMKETFQVLEGN